MMIGFESGECIKCYCEQGANIPCDDHDICLQCIGSICNSSDRAYRFIALLKSGTWDIALCEYCGIPSAIAIKVSICDEHLVTLSRI